VVVAIIAVLVSLLLPALGQARLLMKANQCVRNLRHIGESLVFYAGDYSDNLPPYNQGPLGPPGVDNCWSYALVATGHIRVENPSELVCPICHPIPNVDPNNKRDHNRSYIYNDWKCLDGVSGALKISELTGNSAAMPLVTEHPGPDAQDWIWGAWAQPNHGIWWNAGWGMVANYTNGAGERVRYLIPAHENRSGVLFGDFHAAMTPVGRAGLLWRP